MKPSMLVAVLAATVACKQTQRHEVADRPTATSVTPSGSASADPWSKPAAAKDPLKHPLFWSIEKDGKTSYALGTMHMGVDPQTRIPQIVWQNIAQQVEVTVDFMYRPL